MHPAASEALLPRWTARPSMAATPVVRELLTQSPLHLVLRLTVLLLMLYGGSGWQIMVPVRVLGLLALLSPRVLVHPLTWLTILTAVAWGNALEWHSIDNHKFLMTYWTAACALAVASSSPLGVLRWNSRALIAISFTLATIWKLVTADFLDGRALGFLLLTDPRLEGLATVLCDVPRNLLAENRAILGLASVAPHPGLLAELSATAQGALAGRILALWTVLIEGAIAVAFLVGRGKRSLHLRNALLLAFLVTTYPILPVLGFAFLLAVLALAGSDESPGWRLAFLATIVLSSAITIPWQSLLG